MMLERLFHRLGHRYLLVLMILTRLFGSVGGMGVIYYVELTLNLPSPLREHFRLYSALVVVFSCSMTVLIAHWETRRLTCVLKKLRAGAAVDGGEARAAGYEAATFARRHHLFEAWFVPCTTLVPDMLCLKLLDDAPTHVLTNLTLTVFMGIAMALMSTYFVLEYSIQPVIRYLLDQGVAIDFSKIPPGRLRRRFGVSFALIILTTALMIGTLARQRAADIIMDRQNQELAVQNLQNHSLIITVVAVVIGIVYSTVLADSVALRVKRLTDAMGRVAKGQLSERLQSTGNDEIDSLTRHFNAMVRELEHNDHTIRDLNLNLQDRVRERTAQLESTVQALQETQSQLTDVAHRAGMAEVATGVLHNVGNVLNSVNISVSLLTDQIRRSKLAELERFLARLDEQGERLSEFLATDGRSTKLVEFLHRVHERLRAEQSEAIRETESLAQKVEHIKGIIHAQQAYARQVAFVERVHLGQLIDDVILLHAESIRRHEIEMQVSSDAMPTITVEKAKLLQVIDNLVKNAVESIAQSGATTRRITIQAHPVEPAAVRLEISDTGGGSALRTWDACSATVSPPRRPGMASACTLRRWPSPAWVEKSMPRVRARGREPCLRSNCRWSRIMRMRPRDPIRWCRPRPWRRLSLPRHLSHRRGWGPGEVYHLRAGPKHAAGRALRPLREAGIGLRTRGMLPMSQLLRILVIDDNQDIHEDFRKVFARAADPERDQLDRLQADFFDDAPVEEATKASTRTIEIDSAFQGKEGIERAREAVRQGRPHLMAFVDVRMPPGMDGVQTVKKLWEDFPDLPCVLCTAYSDYDWQQTRRELANAKNLLILKKPFDPVEVLQIVDSIADKAVLSEASREYRTALESQIRELQLAQHELRQANLELAAARIEAEKAAQAKGEFLANMSHELRTPLNGVIAMTDMLLYTGLDVQQEKYVRTAKRSGETLLELINDILDYSKIESGKVVLEDTEFTLHHEIESVNTVVARKCQEKGLELACFVDPHALLRLRGDPARMRQVLANLTSNAVKFTERGEIVIEITVDREEGDKVWVRFLVRDTGIGIPADRRDRLFNSFSQVDASTTRKYGGTGLGLAISKQLCQIMGGEIGFESTPGVGSAFWFSLPFARVGGSEAAASVLPPDFKGRRLLLVDDNPKMREVLDRQLRAWGLEIATADSLPRAAAAALHAEEGGQPFSAVLLDCDIEGAMPEQLPDTVCSYPPLTRTPLILLVPLGHPGRFSELQGKLVAGLVNKPIVPSELFNVLLPLNRGRNADWRQQREQGKFAAPSPRRLPLPQTDHAHARILLAEDNPINQTVVKQILKCFGYSFDIVSNGKEALDALRRNSYDLVLMDCQMPEMDGYEATRIVRQWEDDGQLGGTGPLPIIALTANALEGDRQKCLRAGMTDYLSKPLHPEQLLEAIEKYLRALQRESGGATGDEGGGQPPGGAGAEPLAPLNFTAFVERCMGDESFALQVLAEFQTQLPGELEQMTDCLESDNYEGLARHAHTVKGLAANVSADALRDVSHQLEQAARAKTRAVSARSLELVRREWSRLRAHLATLPCPATATAM